VNAVCVDGSPHRWRDEPAQVSLGRVWGPWQVCTGCWRGIVLDASSLDGHPDAEMVHLSADAQEFLAWLDTELSGGR
jgi:hypothetical protein